jgi:hypothetical protein
VIASQSGHRLPALTPEQNKALATTPADELLALHAMKSQWSNRKVATVTRLH